MPHFVVRVGNGRGNFLYSPEIRLSYIRFRHSPEGEAVHTVSPASAHSPCLGVYDSGTVYGISKLVHFIRGHWHQWRLEASNIPVVSVLAAASVG